MDEEFTRRSRLDPEESAEGRARCREGEAAVRLRLQASEELKADAVDDLKVLEALELVTYTHLLAHRPDLVQRIGEAYALSIRFATEGEEQWAAAGLSKSEWLDQAEGAREAAMSSLRHWDPYWAAADMYEMRASTVTWPVHIWFRDMVEDLDGDE
jgi:hypothetical protein